MLNVDFRNPKEIELIKRKLIGKADILLESMRPNVLSEMKMDPKALHEINEKLVIARLSGWGHLPSPQRDLAGHDAQYLAMSGLLDKFRRSKDGNPAAPTNMLADFSAGSLGLMN